jgi:hypothetical protein
LGDVVQISIGRAAMLVYVFDPFGVLARRAPMQRIGRIHQRPFTVVNPVPLEKDSLVTPLRICLLCVLEVVNMKNAILVTRALGIEKPQLRPRPVDSVVTRGVMKGGYMGLAIIDANGAAQHADARNGVRYILREFGILHMEDSVVSPTDSRHSWAAGPTFRLGSTKHGISRIASELLKTMFKPS